MNKRVHLWAIMRFSIHSSAIATVTLQCSSLDNSLSMSFSKFTRSRMISCIALFSLWSVFSGNYGDRRCNAGAEGWHIFTPIYIIASVDLMENVSPSMDDSRKSTTHPNSPKMPLLTVCSNAHL